jgi:hypothetical protein
MLRGDKTMDRDIFIAKLENLFLNLAKPCNTEYLARTGKSSQLPSIKEAYARFQEKLEEIQDLRAKRKRFTQRIDDTRELIRPRAGLLKSIIRDQFPGDHPILGQLGMQTRYRRVKTTLPNGKTVKRKQVVRASRSGIDEYSDWYKLAYGVKRLEQPYYDAVYQNGWQPERTEEIQSLLTQWRTLEAKRQMAISFHQAARGEIKRLERKLRSWYSQVTRQLRYEVTLDDPENKDEVLANLGLSKEDQTGAKATPKAVKKPVDTLPVTAPPEANLSWLDRLQKAGKILLFPGKETNTPTDNKQANEEPSPDKKPNAVG